MTDPAIDCCCGGPCQFCCLPKDYSIAPGGILADIPFALVGCGGGSGVFKTHPGDEPCQTEQVYDTTYVPSLSSIIYTETAGVCSLTPCSTAVVLKLECSALFAEPGDDQQCDRLRLWIGTILKQVGDTGEKPGGGTTSVSWTWVRPTACVCDAVNGVAATFPLNVVIDGTGLPDGTAGACIGNKLNYCKVGCSATVVI